MISRNLLGEKAKVVMNKGSGEKCHSCESRNPEKRSEAMTKIQEITTPQFAETLSDSLSLSLSLI